MILKKCLDFETFIFKKCSDFEEVIFKNIMISKIA
jgi:hypothetical protein